MQERQLPGSSERRVLLSGLFVESLGRLHTVSQAVQSRISGLVILQLRGHIGLDRVGLGIGRRPDRVLGRAFIIVGSAERPLAPDRRERCHVDGRVVGSPTQHSNRPQPFESCRKVPATEHLTLAKRGCSCCYV